MKLYFYIQNGKKLSPKREGGYCIKCENGKGGGHTDQLTQQSAMSHSVLPPKY